MLELRPIEAATPELSAALETARLPTEDLGEGGRSFFAAVEDGATIGFAGYELYGPDVLLRSMVVLPERRGRGYGHAMTEAVLSEAARAGARTAYLLTTTAADFFARQGFVPLERSGAPAAILATRQAAAICSSAALLVRSL